jgi:hypothetical protein
MPLILPGETGIEGGNLGMPIEENGMVNQGRGDNSQVKGKGKRPECSKSFVMTNLFVYVVAGQRVELRRENFQRRLFTLAVVATMFLLILSKETQLLMLLRSMTMAVYLKMIQ